MAEFKKVLITGGAGFIGSNYVHHCLAAHPDWQLVVLDKLTYAGNMENLQSVLEKIEFVQGDISDPEVVSQAMREVDLVVNFAAETHVDRSLVDSSPFVRTNVEGTLVLLEAARHLGVKRFCHISTDEVYGDLVGMDERSTESSRFRPRSPYAATKAAAEHLVFSYGISYGLDVVITRGSNNYGPCQYPEKIIPLFITNAAEDTPLPLYNDGSAVRDYIHVLDHCAGIDVVIDKGETGSAYNLGAGSEISGREVAETILELMGKGRELITFVSDRPGHDYRYAMDVSAAQSLGWCPTRQFKDGLAQTIQWYQDNESWWRAVKQKMSYKTHQQAWYSERK